MADVDGLSMRFNRLAVPGRTVRDKLDRLVDFIEGEVNRQLPNINFSLSDPPDEMHCYDQFGGELDADSETPGDFLNWKGHK